MNNDLNVVNFGSGEPLILLPGWGWDSGIWEPLIEPLSEHFQLFLIDLPPSATIQEVASTLFTRVPEKAIWLGWSLGGMIAWWVALNYPSKITRLITVATSPKFVAEGDWPGVLPQVLDKFKDALISDYRKTLEEFLELQLRGSTLFPPPCLPNSSDNIDALLNNLALLRTLDLRADLHKIRCPSTHLFGSHDTLVPKQIVPMLQSRLPNSHFEIIKRTGHIPFLTHTHDFLRIITASK